MDSQECTGEDEGRVPKLRHSEEPVNYIRTTLENRRNNLNCYVFVNRRVGKGAAARIWNRTC